MDATPTLLGADTASSTSVRVVPVSLLISFRSYVW
jgi:hypothetical protein